MMYKPVTAGGGTHHRCMCRSFLALSFSLSLSHVSAQSLSGSHTPGTASAGPPRRGSFRAWMGKAVSEFLVARHALQVWSLASPRPLPPSPWSGMPTTHDSLTLISLRAVSVSPREGGKGDSQQRSRIEGRAKEIKTGSRPDTPSTPSPNSGSGW